MALNSPPIRIENAGTLKATNWYAPTAAAKDIRLHLRRAKGSLRYAPQLSAGKKVGGHHRSPGGQLPLLVDEDLEAVSREDSSQLAWSEK